MAFADLVSTDSNSKCDINSSSGCSSSYSYPSTLPLNNSLNRSNEINNLNNIKNYIPSSNQNFYKRFINYISFGEESKSNNKNGKYMIWIAMLLGLIFIIGMILGYVNFIFLIQDRKYLDNLHQETKIKMPTHFNYPGFSINPSFESRMWNLVRVEGGPLRYYSEFQHFIYPIDCKKGREGRTIRLFNALENKNTNLTYPSREVSELKNKQQQEEQWTKNPRFLSQGEFVDITCRGDLGFSFSLPYSNNDNIGHSKSYVAIWSEDLLRLVGYKEIRNNANNDFIKFFITLKEVTWEETNKLIPYIKNIDLSYGEWLRKAIYTAAYFCGYPIVCLFIVLGMIIINVKIFETVFQTQFKCQSRLSNCFFLILHCLVLYCWFFKVMY